jgi:hypothetical protein
MAEHDWLEAGSAILGSVFLAAAVACAWALVVAVTSLGEVETELAGTTGVLAGSSPSTIEATRWFGIVLFGLLTVLTAAVGWFLAGDAIRRMVGRSRARA